MKINGNKYTKKQILDKCKEIMYSHPIGTKLSGEELDFVMAVLKQHYNYEDKMKYGCKGIVIRNNPYNPKYREFRIITDFGDEITFSPRKCLNKPKHSAQVKRAMRNIIHDQIIEFRNELFKSGVVKCEIPCEVLNQDNVHIDHIYPFDALVKDFLELNNITFEDIKLVNEGNNQPQFVDTNLAQKWYDYHKQNAKLRPLSARENLKLSNKE